MVGRLVDRVIENPAMSGGLLVMALTTAAVVSNAVFLQKARHPEPWFMTRPAVIDASTPEAIPFTVPSPRPRAELPVEQGSPPTEAEVPTPVLAPVLAQYPPPSQAQSPAVPDKAVIFELQKNLAEWGLYKGAVDGISGSRTQAAITAYEQARGLPVTGQPSVEVLDNIRTASVRPVESQPEPASVSPAPVAPVEALAPQPVAAVAPQPLDTAASAETGDPLASEIEIATRNRYLTVQRALNQIGYGPVVEDGRVNEDTENAIRRFELDNGLPITGTPEDEVIKRLVSIGAIQST